MKIHASLLAADIFEQANWINRFASQVDAFHVDIIDPSFANFIGIDFRIIPKLSESGYTFYIHYMAKWNDELIRQIVDYKPAGIFFHQKHIENRALFEELKQTTDIGIALELGEGLSEKPEIDVETYVLMNVNLGYCGQKFDSTNIALSHELKRQNKTIVSDGGVNLSNLELLKHFDALVIGNALNTTSIKQIQEALK